jgi:hypothetical protein
LSVVDHKVSVVVIDGITIGHPCCGQHNCQHPLTSNRNRYCPIHATLNTKCAIVGCDADVVEGTMTCPDIIHQEVEHVKKAHGEGRFQLKNQLAWQRIAHPNDSVADDVNLTELEDVDAAEEGFSLDDNGQIVPDLGYILLENNEMEDASNTSQDTVEGARAEAGSEIPEKRKLRAQFGRKRTHNEQIMVAPCGMILSRATFFGAEAVSTVIVCLLLINFVP